MDAEMSAYAVQKYIDDYDEKIFSKRSKGKTETQLRAYAIEAAIMIQEMLLHETERLPEFLTGKLSYSGNELVKSFLEDMRDKYELLRYSSSKTRHSQKLMIASCIDVGKDILKILEEDDKRYVRNRKEKKI